MELKPYYKRLQPWAVKALERDNYQCTECKSTLNVIVHHLDESRKEGLKLMNNNLDNLISLCKTCHASIHKQTLRYTHPNLALIKELYDTYQNYTKVAKHLGISRQRVHQIIKKAFPEIF